MKECLSNGIDELANDNEDQQAQAKSFFLPCPLICLPPEDEPCVCDAFCHGAFQIFLISVLFTFP